MSAALWSVAPLQEGHALEMRELFERVFSHAMPPALWDWKYGDGRGIALVARDVEGRIVGHYGGMPRAVVMDGQPQTAVQIGDVMVAPEVRGVLTRSGPFAMMTSSFLDRYIGHGKPFLVGFGFPSERHLKIAQRHRLYAEVDSVHELHWARPPTGAQGLLSWWLRLEPLDWTMASTETGLDHLWQQQQRTSGAWIVPVRDAARWRYRFAQHPTHRYQAWWLRERLTQRLLGAVVLRPATTAGQPWELMDWVAPVSRVHQVVTAARTVAARHDAGLMGWFSSGLAALIGAQAQVIDIGVRVPTSIRQPGPAPEVLRGRWWLTGGDSDFR